MIMTESFAEKLHREHQDLMRFVVYWGAGYNPKETMIVKLDYFFPARGYEAEHIEQIEGMAVGEVVDLSDMTSVQFILRVE
jgi:hypothetical protein